MAKTSTESDVFGQQLAVAKDKKRGRIWRALGLMALFGIGGLAAYSLTPSGQATRKLVVTGLGAIQTVKQNPDLIFEQAGGDHVNILLIGRDVNWKPGKVWDPHTKSYRPFHVKDKETQARSDSMIVMSLDKNRNLIRMVSLPRDATVHLPPNDFNVHRGKLNAAHSYGGPELLRQTLHDELGLTIHHYAVIKFDGFKKLIDEVGGVTINVDGALKRDRRTGKLYRGDLDYDDNWGNLHIHLKPGVQRLNGQQAHDFVRFRMDLEGDPGRIRRQQQVMRALAKEVMHAPVWKIPGLITEVRRQFESDLDDDEIASAAYFAKGIGNPDKIQPLTLFGVYNTRGSLTLNRSKNEKLMRVVFGPTFSPDRFLQNSPSTEDDELGITNDSNPGAQEVLREAGLLKKDGSIVRNYAADAPVRSESASSTSTSSTSASSTSASSTSASSGDESNDSDHERLAAADGSSRDESAASRRSSRIRAHSSDNRSSDNESSRNRRKATPRASSHQSEPSSGDSRSETRSENRDESPVPQPEAGNSESRSPATDVASPVPQPEKE